VAILSLQEALVAIILNEACPWRICFNVYPLEILPGKLSEWDGRPLYSSIE
jgi:hypothetical protein